MYKVFQQFRQSYTHLNLREGVKPAPKYGIEVPLALFLMYVFDRRVQEGLDVVFLIDRSESMKLKPGQGWGDTPSRLQAVVETLQILADQLRPTDRAGVIAFDHEALEVCSLSPASDLKATVAKIPEPRGSTDIGCGLRKAKEVLKARTEDRAAVIVLLTDGFAGRAKRDGEAKTEMQIQAEYHQDAIVASTEIAAAGLDLATLGFGDEFDRELLSKIDEEAGKHGVRWIDTQDKANSALSAVLQQQQATNLTQVRVEGVLNVQHFQWEGVWQLLPARSLRQKIGLGTPEILAGAKAAQWSYPLQNVRFDRYGILLSGRPKLNFTEGSVPVGQFWLTRMGKPITPPRDVTLQVTAEPVKGTVTVPHNPDQDATNAWLIARITDLRAERDEHAEFGRHDDAIRVAELIIWHDEQAGNNAERGEDEGWLQRYCRDKKLSRGEALGVHEKNTTTTSLVNEQGFDDAMEEKDAQECEVDEKNGTFAMKLKGNTARVVKGLRNRRNK